MPHQREHAIELFGTRQNCSVVWRETVPASALTEMGTDTLTFNDIAIVSALDHYSLLLNKKREFYVCLKQLLLKHTQ